MYRCTNMILCFLFFLSLRSQALGSHAPIVPTKILGDPDELDRHLLRSGADAHNLRRAQAAGDNNYDNGTAYGPESDLDAHVSLLSCFKLCPGS